MTVSKNINVVCIVQARIGSTRLYGKILKKIQGEYSALDYLIKRLKKSKNISKIVIATSKKTRDNKIINAIKKYKINNFRGSESNVLNRYYKTALKYRADIIVRITSDCPFSDPYLIDFMIKKFIKGKFDFYSNISPRTFPKGLDVEIFTMKALKIANEKADSQFDKEHVTPFIKKSNKFKKGNLLNKKNYSKVYITLDKLEDLKKIRFIAKKIEPKFFFKWRKIIDIYKKF